MSRTEKNKTLIVCTEFLSIKWSELLIRGVRWWYVHDCNYNPQTTTPTKPHIILEYSRTQHRQQVAQLRQIDSNIFAEH